MIFSAEEQQAMTLPQWENLVMFLAASLNNLTAAQPDGWQPLAEEMFQLQGEIATEVMPGGWR